MSDEQRRRYLEAMGITLWVRRGMNPPEPARSDPVHAAASAAGTDVEHLDLDTLRGVVAGCRRCDLHRTRTQTVFGVGNPHPEWLIIGEAPGADEDRQGEPFVGRAGQLLNAMLAAIGLCREEVYIANILKCRPPQNRDPRPEEVACCEPYLRRQVALLAPRIILAVGRIAAQNLLAITTPIGKMRGQVYALGALGVPVVVTYHPAYLLRSPTEKRKAWQDLVLAQRVYREALAKDRR
ncbi:MAG: uracil-DNA glycosylase [Gammaproteobacteria bacterium]